MKKVAEQTGVEIRKPIMLGKDKIWRYKDAPALRFLEEHIYRHSRRFWNEETDAVTLFAARTPGQKWSVSAERS